MTSQRNVGFENARGPRHSRARGRTPSTDGARNRAYAASSAGKRTPAARRASVMARDTATLWSSVR